MNDLVPVNSWSEKELLLIDNVIINGHKYIREFERRFPWILSKMPKKVIPFYNNILSRISAEDIMFFKDGLDSDAHGIDWSKFIIFRKEKLTYKPEVREYIVFQVGAENKYFVRGVPQYPRWDVYGCIENTKGWAAASVTMVATFINIKESIISYAEQKGLDKKYVDELKMLFSNISNKYSDWDDYTTKKARELLSLDPEKLLLACGGKEK